jgi:membrane-bound lytic murein transglycosylase D
VKAQAAPTPQPSSPSKITHTVSSGDTVFNLSKKYGVSVDELKSWNGIGSQNIISIGQKLVIFRP